MLGRKKKKNELDICVKVDVPKDCCEIRFGQHEQGAYYTALDGPKTAQGDSTIMHFNVEGQLVSIELESSEKPCMKQMLKVDRTTGKVTKHSDKMKDTTEGEQKRKLKWRDLLPI